jgi:DNA relaxase NicK
MTKNNDIEVAIDILMTQAQVFASAWALVGSRFDAGNCMKEAEEAKEELRTMIKIALNAALV